MYDSLILAGLAVSLAAAQSGAPNKWQPWTAEGKPEFAVKRAASKPALDGNWNSPVWAAANTLEIANFFEHVPEGVPDKDFKPRTQARVLYDNDGLYLFFRVEDKYVRSIATEYRGKVWEDACAEFFVQPKADRGYFNFEINCGGTMLLSYHENPDWKGESLRNAGGVPWELAQQVKIFHSMPKVVDPEIAENTTWVLEYFIPFSLLEAYIGDIGNPAGQTWRANFYKCAETNSHPHWASWSPIVDVLDFHTPRFFGILKFAE